MDRQIDTVYPKAKICRMLAVKVGEGLREGCVAHQCGDERAVVQAQLAKGRRRHLQLDGDGEAGDDDQDDGCEKDVGAPIGVRHWVPRRK